MHRVGWVSFGFGAAVVCFCTFLGCSSVQVLDASSRPIFVKEVQQRDTTEGMHVSFPSGMYLPDFKTTTGTYYRATDKLVVTTNRENRARTGGLYLPSETDPDQRQGVWFDDQESTPGEFHLRLSAPTATHRFADAVPVQSEAP
jgi:hypothetical protein